jgi:hypothetical protein
MDLLSVSDIRSKIDSLVLLAQEIGHPNALKIWEAGTKVKLCLNDLDDAVSKKETK